VIIRGAAVWYQPRGSALKCGINRAYLSTVERSERNVSIYNIARIARSLEVEIWRQLLEDE